MLKRSGAYFSFILGAVLFAGGAVFLVVEILATEAECMSPRVFIGQRGDDPCFPLWLYSVSTFALGLGATLIGNLLLRSLRTSRREAGPQA